jgi:hypothetical protein
VSEPGVEIIPSIPASNFPAPAIIAAAGDKTSEHFLEFFGATIRNRKTRATYVQAAAQFFRWCQEHHLRLASIQPLHVSAYIESRPMTAPSIKQPLAALGSLRQGAKIQPADGVTPIMEAEQMRQLLDSIKITRQVKVAGKHGGGA